MYKKIKKTANKRNYEKTKIRQDCALDRCKLW